MGVRDELLPANFSEGRALAEEHKCYFLETSALDNADKMIEKVFSTLAEDIIVKKGDEEEPKAGAGGKKIDLGDAGAKAEEKKGCC